MIDLRLRWEFNRLMPDCERRSVINLRVISPHLHQGHLLQRMYRPATWILNKIASIFIPC